MGSRRLLCVVSAVTDRAISPLSEHLSQLIVQHNSRNGEPYWSQGTTQGVELGAQRRLADKRLTDPDEVVMYTKRALCRALWTGIGAAMLSRMHTERSR